MQGGKRMVLFETDAVYKRMSIQDSGERERTQTIWNVVIKLECEQQMSFKVSDDDLKDMGKTIIGTCMPQLLEEFTP